MKFTVLLILLVFTCAWGGSAVTAQDTDAVEAGNVFTMEEFLTGVQLYHPLALRAGLLTERARAELLFARGNLDPKLVADWNQKNFDDKLYYQYYSGKLMVPTVFGVDVVAGYEQSDGVFLSDERKTDEFGLWNVGLEADLFQGLVFNERRMALDRAAVIQRLNEQDRRIAINDLLYEAGVAYVDWQQYYYYGIVQDTNVALARTYFNNTRVSAENGEYTSMDTLEAFILLQDAITEQQKNENNLIKARQAMENFIWFENTPLELQPGVVPGELPENIPILSLAPATNLIANNPVIQSYLFKQEIYEIEQRLKRIKARPKMKVKYNALLATGEESVRPSYNSNDFKWGFDFSVPLLLRQSRANIQLGDIKLRENAYFLRAKQNEMSNKLEASVRQLDLLREQVAITRDNVGRYALLLEGENIKFIYGESSVFLLNKRQEKFIDAQLKLIELKAKVRNEILNYRSLTNTLIEGLD